MTTIKDSFLLGLVGRGITQSRTPEMHMAEARAQNLCCIYQLHDVDDLPVDEQSLNDVLRTAEMAGYDGLNITFPYKVEVLSLLDEISPEAAAIGSVNTVLFRGGRRVGHNTDYWGFAESFRVNMTGANVENVLLIGAGGAGGAVAHALADCGVQHLKIHDVDFARAEQLAALICANRPDVLVEAIASLDQKSADTLSGVVNASPVGMAKLPGSPFPKDLLRSDIWVADIVYFPLETELLNNARRLGCRVLPGSGMAVFQAVKAFELFTGRGTNPDRMRETFNTFDDQI
ncbi:MAG: shikimate dehydrogenase [Hoeflea sp.]|uniref:shikimate dehydrogenase n=1 Tax=Hoeflea sp. TaxID=1940281 RepID=UPI003297E6E9